MLDFIRTHRQRLPLRKVISHKFALDDIDRAFASRMGRSVDSGHPQLHRALS
jgi:hypothetical protein